MRHDHISSGVGVLITVEVDRNELLAVAFDHTRKVRQRTLSAYNRYLVHALLYSRCLAEVMRESAIAYEVQTVHEALSSMLLHNLIFFYRPNPNQPLFSGF